MVWNDVAAIVAVGCSTSTQDGSLVVPQPTPGPPPQEMLSGLTALQADLVCKARASAQMCWLGCVRFTISCLQPT
jgi:hypothetical protein